MSGEAKTTVTNSPFVADIASLVADAPHDQVNVWDHYTLEANRQVLDHLNIGQAGTSKEGVIERAIEYKNENVRTEQMLNVESSLNEHGEVVDYTLTHSQNRLDAVTRSEVTATDNGENKHKAYTPAFKVVYGPDSMVGEVELNVDKLLRGMHIRFVLANGQEVLVSRTAGTIDFTELSLPTEQTTEINRIRDVILGNIGIDILDDVASVGISLKNLVRNSLSVGNQQVRQLFPANIQTEAASSN